MTLKFCLIIGLSTSMVVGFPNPQEDDVCMTTADSHVPEKQCVFPFIHDDVTYNGCPIDPIDETKRWCSTKTKETGVHVNGNWGYCSPGCKPAEGIPSSVDDVDEDDEYEDEEDVCLTSVESVDPEKECVFPFTFNNFTYDGCPSDPLDNTKRWCSTKSDGIHTSDSNNWGYCTSGCNPEVFPDELLISTDANNETQTETCDYTACNGFTFKLDVFDKVETFGQCQFPAGENGAKDDYFCFVNEDSACEDKAPYGDEEDGLFITTLACKDPKTPLPRGFSFIRSFTRGFFSSYRRSSGSRRSYSYGSKRYSKGGSRGSYRPIKERPRYPKSTPNFGSGNTISTNGNSNSGKSCTTVGGKRAYRSCIFPFIFNGVTYNTCTYDSSKFTGGKAWCSTSTDRYGRHRSGTWGTCGSDCTPSSTTSGSVENGGGRSGSSCRPQSISGDWCARLYTDNNYGGQRQDIPDTGNDHFSTSCGVSSIKINRDCSAFLISGDEAVAIDSDSRFFNDLNQVSDVQCSCFREYRENIGQDICYEETYDEESGEWVLDCAASFGNFYTNNAGTSKVGYQVRDGRYKRNCSWRKRGRRWRCVRN